MKRPPSMDVPGIPLRLKRGAPLNSHQAMSLLGVGQSRLWRLIVSGELEAFNVATKDEPRPVYRITWQALNAFIAKRKVKPKALVRGKGGMKLKKS